MDEAPGLSEQYRMSSPWPLFVALGIPLSELGILFGLFPVAVGGLLLFSGSVAGMLTESGYVSSPWKALAGFAGLLLVVGVAFAFTEIDLVMRGYAIIVTAGLLLFGSLLGSLFVHEDPVPV